ncbi:MAG: aspartate dehydrogenase [Candidatus Omnitrophota bacterium]
MAKQLKIGIVGCGAIGSSLARAIQRDFGLLAKVVALYDINAEKSARLSELLKRRLSVKTLGQLIKKSGLVIEAASAKCSFEVAKKSLAAGRGVMIMSVGGLISHLGELTRLARQHHGRVYIPSGAISGVDALKAANIGKIRSVTLTTRKNPLSFRGVDYLAAQNVRLDKITSDKILFSGPAEKAVKYFPQNINVAAVLSLAGIGASKTKVIIVASPSAKKNIHEIEIEAESGRVFTRTENILHPDNPKTSFLAVLSAIAVLKQILEPLRIGT